METYCNANCSICRMNKVCKGCVLTKGKPFGGDCVLANICKKDLDNKEELMSLYKERLIKEINSLCIKDMPKVTELFALNGFYVNLEYVIDGQKKKFLNDQAIYLGAQLKKPGTNRFFGVSCDDNIILVSEYSENGENPKLILFKERQTKK